MNEDEKAKLANEFRNCKGAILHACKDFEIATGLSIDTVYFTHAVSNVHGRSIVAVELTTSDR